MGATYSAPSGADDTRLGVTAGSLPDIRPPVRSSIGRPAATNGRLCDEVDGLLRPTWPRVGRTATTNDFANYEWRSGDCTDPTDKSVDDVLYLCSVHNRPTSLRPLAHGTSATVRPRRHTDTSTSTLRDSRGRIQLN